MRKRNWNKYGARPTLVDGIRFHSKREAKRYGELKLLESQGKISNLELQPKFPFELDEKRIGTYIADFRYLEKNRSGEWSDIIEDVKGYQTAEFKLKKKLFEAFYPGLELRLI